MSYDFPASPAENDEYTPPVGGQVYIYKAPRWLVKGIPPAGGGGGGGIDEAPIDGKQYGREDTAWTEVLPNPDWVTLAGKPATFPPTVPIPWTDVSGKPATFPPTVPIAWTDVSGKPATFPPSLPIPSSGVTGLDLAQAAQDTAIGTKLNSSAYTAADVLAKLLTVDGVGSSLDADLLDGQSGAYYLAWANFTGKPSTFPPTLPIAQSDVTNLVTDLAAKAPLASPTFTGDAKAVTPATADNDTSIATTAFVKAQGYGLASDVTGKVAKTGDTMTGPLLINKPASGQQSAIFGQMNGSYRWGLFLGDATAESGDVGSDFGVYRYGTVQGTVLSISRATGLATVFADPAAPLGIATKQYVDAKPGGAFTSNVPPATPVDGQLWWKSDTGNTYIWYDDGSSAQWVQVNVTTLPADYRTAETRNRIVNGAMQISQENGDAANTAVGYYMADQWTETYTAGMTLSFQRVQVRTPNGSVNRIRATVTSAKGSLAASDLVRIYHPIEGIKVADFNYGIATAQQCILRFGWKSPAGTYSVMFRNAASNRSYIANFTISAGQANTDTEQTFAIPGDATGTWAIDTTLGLLLQFIIAAGSDFTGVSGWQAGNKVNTSANTNGVASAGAVYELFDVGLYLDPLNTGVPPRWQMPDEAEELRACHRYWEAVNTTVRWDHVMTVGSAAGFTQFFGAKRTPPAVATLSNALAGWSAPIYASSKASTVLMNLQPTAVGPVARTADVIIGVNARL